MAIDIELQVISKGYDRKTCWVHARPGIIPGDPSIALITTYKARVDGMDVFYSINDFRSDDGGKTWAGPTEHDTLGRRPSGEPGIEESICDFWPKWHEKSGKMLGIGHTVRYIDDEFPLDFQPRSTAYSTYDPVNCSWSNWKKLELPLGARYENEGAGSVQRVDLPNGDILLPTYVGMRETHASAEDHMPLTISFVTVMRCTFDGDTLRYVEHGNEMSLPTGRGLCEPSIAFFGGRYYLTMRNDDNGYISSGTDGLNFDEPKIWTWDDGSELGNYNTQQHWVTMPDALYLVYTRRGANNDHIFRHRAPLFIAQIDPDKLCVIRETEQILVPEHGARLCNFGVDRVSEKESWAAVTEWMQTKAPNQYNYKECEKYGSDNRIYLAKIRSRV